MASSWPANVRDGLRGPQKSPRRATRRRQLASYPPRCPQEVSTTVPDRIHVTRMASKIAEGSPTCLQDVFPQRPRGRRHWTNIDVEWFRPVLAFLLLMDFEALHMDYGPMMGQDGPPGGQKTAQASFIETAKKRQRPPKSQPRAPHRPPKSPNVPPRGPKTPTTWPPKPPRHPQGAPDVAIYDPSPRAPPC